MADGHLGTAELNFRSAETLVDALGHRPMEVEPRIVHLWGVGLEASRSRVDQFRRWLSDDERIRAARFVRETDGRQYLIAHASVRAVLARYLGCRPERIAYGRETGGKPVLNSAPVEGAGITFNLSHSHGRMVLAVARDVPVGTDVELVRQDVDVTSLAKRFYSPVESARLCRLSPDERRQEFYRCWVAKEAVLKGQGIGLPSLHECEIVPEPTANRASINLISGSTLFPDWQVRWLALEAGWVGAVARRGTDWTVRSMT